MVHVQHTVIERRDKLGKRTSGLQQRTDYTRLEPFSTRFDVPNVYLTTTEDQTQRAGRIVWSVSLVACYAVRLGLHAALQVGGLCSDARSQVAWRSCRLLYTRCCALLDWY
jgi:hypothetical protein